MQPTPINRHLRYAPDLSWIEEANGQRIDLHRRTALRRVLRALVLERHSAPGRAISVYDLFDRAWPGDDAHPECAANRTYVAIARLRKLGLATAIQTTYDGFRIDPRLELSEDQTLLHRRVS